MKRYLLFFGERYYPSGGWGDFCSDFDTIEDAKRFLQDCVFDWYEIVDSHSKEIVV